MRKGSGGLAAVGGTAAREAKAMKDDYVSVEHVFLALLDEQTQNTSELFRAFSITKDKFLQQLTAVLQPSPCMP